MNPCLVRRSAGCLVLSLILATGPVAAEVINRIVATIDGEPITQYELEGFSRTIRGRDGTGTGDALDALVLNKIIDKESAAAGVLVDDAEVDAFINDIKQRNRLDDEQLKAVLQQQGISYTAYREQIRDEVQRQRLIAREISGKVNITPEEVERYYKANLAKYTQPAEIHVAHIVFALDEDAPRAQVVAVRAKADAVYEQLRDGADFADMAAKYSEDSSGKDGGDLGWFKTGELIDSLEDAAAKLEPGQFSQPVRGPLGLHIVELVERKGEGYKPLEGQADEIKQKLYQAALEERYERWLNEELRARHHVDVR